MRGTLPALRGDAMLPVVARGEPRCPAAGMRGDCGALSSLPRRVPGSILPDAGVSMAPPPVPPYPFPRGVLGGDTPKLLPRGVRAGELNPTPKPVPLPVRPPPLCKR